MSISKIYIKSLDKEVVKTKLILWSFSKHINKSLLLYLYTPTDLTTMQINGD